MTLKAGCLTVTTDSTGDAEVVLPAGSISGTEITDDTILEADLNAQGGPTDEWCLTYEDSGGALFEWQACGGGGFSGEVDDTTNDALTFSNDDASPPAGTVNSIFRDNTGDLNINTITNKTLNVQIAGGDQYNFSASGLEFNSNDITGIGNITATGAITIASTGAGNDVIIDGADILDVQDNATFAGTVGVSGTATFTGDITADDADADTILIGQSGATDDTVTIAGAISLTDDNWSITDAGLITTASNIAVCSSSSRFIII